MVPMLRAVMTPDRSAFSALRTPPRWTWASIKPGSRYFPCRSIASASAAPAEDAAEASDDPSVTRSRCDTTVAFIKMLEHNPSITLAWVRVKTPFDVGRAPSKVAS